MSPQPHWVPRDESHIQNSFTPVQNTSHKVAYLAYSQLQRQKKKKEKKRTHLFVSLQQHILVNI